MIRNEAIKAMKTALEQRSGKKWSVTGGRGTAYGWITIDAPPARRTWGHRQVTALAGTLEQIRMRDEVWEEYDTGAAGGNTSPAERAVLAKLLELDVVPHQGVSVPASLDYYNEYLARCEGRKPERLGEPYWD